MINTSIRKRIAPFLKGRIPGQLVIQFTDVCNAKCPQCGMRVTNRYPRKHLPMNELERTLDHAAAVGVQAVSFTGGEPFLHLKNLLHLIHYAGRAGIPMIRTGTNGFLFSGSQHPDFKDRVRRLADQLAATPLRNLWISIDSADPAVHEEMRGFPGIVRGIEKALPIFHNRGIYPSANLGINRNMVGTYDVKQAPSPQNRAALFYREYRNACRRFYKSVIELGFTMVNTCYPMSIETNGNTGDLEAVYGATTTDEIVSFSVQEKMLLYRAIMDSIPEFRSCIRIFTPLSSLYALVAQHSRGKKTAYPCRGGIDFFFVDARKGDTFPCGYRGNDNLGKFWEISWADSDTARHCTRCDWECFRDPSELIGPILDLVRRPSVTMRKMQIDKQYRRLWVHDLRYYHTCDFFNGRKPPVYHRLKRYKIDGLVKSPNPALRCIS